MPNISEFERLESSHTHRFLGPDERIRSMLESAANEARVAARLAEDWKEESRYMAIVVAIKDLMPKEQ